MIINHCQRALLSSVSNGKLLPNTPLTKTSAISSPLAGEGKGEGGLPELSYAPIDCSALSVLTVIANVYDESQTYLVNGGPWDCTAHSGTITGISAGDSRKLTIYGKDSSDRIIYRGQATGVTITANQTTNAGSITMSAVGSDTTAPTDGTLSATAGNTQVSLSWSGFSDSGGIASYKLVYSTGSSPSCSTGTQIYSGTSTSYTHTGLTNGTTYYYCVCATDNAGNYIQWGNNQCNTTSNLSICYQMGFLWHRKWSV